MFSPGFLTNPPTNYGTTSKSPKCSFSLYLKWMVPARDVGSLVTTAHVTHEICPRDLNTEKAKQIWRHKIYYMQGGFFLSVRDWIKTKVVLWASVVKQLSMR